MCKKLVITKKLEEALVREFHGERNTPFLRERATDFVMDRLKVFIHKKGYFNIQCNEANNPDGVVVGHRLVVDFSYRVSFGNDMSHGTAVVSLK